MIRLWSINRVLRWTGFRLIVQFEDRADPESWTMIGLRYWGFRFIRSGE